jgi:hypothetical protein
MLRIEIFEMVSAVAVGDLQVLVLLLVLLVAMKVNWRFLVATFILVVLVVGSTQLRMHFDSSEDHVVPKSDVSCSLPETGLQLPAD